MRLPVVMPQSAPAKFSAMAEALIGSLIGRPGLDLTLVDRLETIDDHSTDRMTLEGITVPTAVLNWESVDKTLSSLERIEFRGTRTAHQFDPDASHRGETPRRIFLFDLRSFEISQINDLIAELNRLRESLAIKTFTLSSPATKRSSGGTQRPPDSKPMKSDHVATPASISPTRSSTDMPPPSEPAEVVSSDDPLDQLIDQLDDLDV